MVDTVARVQGSMGRVMAVAPASGVYNSHTSVITIQSH